MRATQAPRYQMPPCGGRREVVIAYFQLLRLCRLESPGERLVRTWEIGGNFLCDLPRGGPFRPAQKSGDEPDTFECFCVMSQGGVKDPAPVILHRHQHRLVAAGGLEFGRIAGGGEDG